MPHRLRLRACAMLLLQPAKQSSSVDELLRLAFRAQ
jgi:hypothetical protein